MNQTLVQRFVKSLMAFVRRLKRLSAVNEQVMHGPEGEARGELRQRPNNATSKQRHDTVVTSHDHD